MSHTESGNIVSPINGSIHDDLEVLFEETVDLANRLKSKARHTHRGEQLSASGRILLQCLHLHGPQTVPALAHIRSTSRQNIQVLVDRLATAGYIGFVANPGHRRSDFVSLTGASRALLASANKREASLLAMLLPHTTETEVRAAAELLRKLRLLLSGERKRRQSAPRPEAVHAPVRRAVSQPTQPEEGEELPVSLL